MREETIIREQKVIGPRGLARFVLDNLDDIKKGRTVDFCGDTENESAWYGVALCRTAQDFDSPYIVLYIDYYGGTPAARIVPVDEEYKDEDLGYLADVLFEVTEADGYTLGKDEEIHAEVVEREPKRA